MSSLAPRVAALLTAGAIASGGAASSLSPDRACARRPAAIAEVRRFAEVLLNRKDARAAYETFASVNMIQRNKPFGNTRASTIAQWETMTSRPGARFEIKGVIIHANVATISFRGRLGPGLTASVTQHDRFSCGVIVEEWAEFTPGSASSAGAAQQAAVVGGARR